MSRHKKSLLRIVGDISLLNSVLEQCVEMEDFQFETPAESNGFKIIKEENPYIKKTEALKKAADMLSLDLESGETSSCCEESDEPLEELFRKISELYKTKKDLALEEENYEKLIVQIRHLASLNVSFEDMFSFEYIKIRFGRMPVDSVPKLSYYDNECFIFLELDRDKDYCWGFYVMPAGLADEIDYIFTALYFDRLRIPPYLLGTGEKAYEGVKRLIETTKEEQDKIDRSLEKLAEENKTLLNRLYSEYLHKSKICELRKKSAATEKQFKIIGSVPKNKLNTAIEIFSEADGVYAAPNPYKNNNKITYTIH
ncbi:MAG: hypothetical protein ACI4JX_02740 [Oscillospiraceae bacterium]